MAYRPPNKDREEKKENAFVKISNRDKSEQSPVDTTAFIPREKTPPPPEPPKIDEIAEFPSLGGKNSSTMQEETMMNFASSIYTPQPKEVKVKAVPDDWVQISRENGETVFTYGDDSKEAIEFMEWLEDFQALRQQLVLERTLERYEKYEEEDLIKYGSKTIQSWEVEDYLKEEEMNRKLMLREQDESDDETSEEEYVDN